MEGSAGVLFGTEVHAQRLCILGRGVIERTYNLHCTPWELCRSLLA